MPLALGLAAAPSAGGLCKRLPIMLGSSRAHLCLFLIWDCVLCIPSSNPLAHTASLHQNLQTFGPDDGSNIQPGRLAGTM